MRQLAYSRLILNSIKSNSKPSSTTNVVDKVVVQEYLRYQNDIKIYEVSIPIDPSRTPIRLSPRVVLVDLLKFNDSLVTRFQESCAFVRNDFKYMLALLKYWLDLSTYQQHDAATANTSKRCENIRRAFLVSFMKLSIIDPLEIERPSREDFMPSNLEKCPTPSLSLKTCDSSIDYVGKYLGVQNDDDAKSSFQLDAELTESRSGTSGGENWEYVREIKTKLNSFCPSFSFYENALKGQTNSGTSGFAKKLDKFLNLKLIHLLNEFQSIYLSFNYVCDVFDNHENDQDRAECDQNDSAKFFRPLSLDCFFNSSFLHNFVEELESRVNPDAFVFDLFGRKSLFKYIYCELSDLFNKAFETV